MEHMRIAPDLAEREEQEEEEEVEQEQEGFFEVNECYLLDVARDLLLGNSAIDVRFAIPLNYLVWAAANYVDYGDIMDPETKTMKDVPLAIIETAARRTRFWHPLPNTEPIATEIRKVWKRVRANMRVIVRS